MEIKLYFHNPKGKSETRILPRVESFLHKSNGDLLVTFEDNSTLEIAKDEYSFYTVRSY